MSEVVSGSLPLDKRTAFVNFLGECRDAGINKVYVESSRVVARDASVAEEFYKLSKNLGVTIVPADVPALYDHCPNPAQKFLRRVMMAFTELEKDLTVQRLKAGLDVKRRAVQTAFRNKQATVGGKPVLRTQLGKAKVNGRASTLQKMKVAGTLTETLLKRLKVACAKFKEDGNLKGQNGLQASLQRMLNMPKLGCETAKRMSKEVAFL